MKNLFFLLLFIGMTSCAHFVDFDYSEFQTHKQAWEALNITNYSYRYEHADVFYTEDTIFFVSNDIITSYTNLGEFYSSNTIAGLFNRIEDAYLDHDGQSADANGIFLEAINVTYDSSYHYPKDVYFVWFYPRTIAVDGWGGWNITAFTNSD